MAIDESWDDEGFGEVDVVDVVVVGLELVLGGVSLSDLLDCVVDDDDGDMGLGGLAGDGDEGATVDERGGLFGLGVLGECRGSEGCNDCE